MTIALDLAVRTSIVLAIGLAAAAGLASRSAALRHCILAAALCASAAVVPFTFIVPVWEVALPVTAGAATAPRVQPAVPLVTAPASEPAPAGARGFVQPLAVAWIIGFVLAATRLFGGLARLRRIASRAERLVAGRAVGISERVAAAYGVRRPIVLLQSGAPHLPATWGVRRPRVLLPADAAGWSDDRLHVVLCHELAHVRRHDWVVQITAEAICAMFWFNPLAWMTCARLRADSEHACDDVVLGTGVAARAYAGHLLDLARMYRRSGSAWVSAMPIAHVSTLERRIAAMLNPRVNRRALSRRAVAATALALAVLTLPAAALRAGQSGPAALTGSIYDPTGGVLPGVDVALEDAGGLTWQATTNASGRFEFPNVGPGRYVLTASLPGFRTLRHEFEPRSARDWDRAITLQVGQVQETITVTATRAAGSLQPGGGPARPLRVGGNVRAPRKELHVKPIYPAAMRAAGREGVVPIEAIIAVDGTVSSVRVVSAQVHPDFAIAAADAVRQWRFSPTLLNGTPVEVVMTVTVAFKLAD